MRMGWIVNKALACMLYLGGYCVLWEVDRRLVFSIVLLQAGDRLWGALERKQRNAFFRLQ